MIILPYKLWIMQSPAIVPKLYWDAYSQEERIKRICYKVEHLEGYLSYLSGGLDDFQDEIRTIVMESERRLAEAMEELREYVDDEATDLRAWVEDKLDHALASQRTWDVTRGQFTDSIDGMRRMFFDVTVDGATVDELATNTRYPSVDDLADCGYNVRALAVRGGNMLGIDTSYNWIAEE